jgi:NAD(P)-dependent dehydrogenase (short-subunit alcohol dehydrogenase family)
MSGIANRKSITVTGTGRRTGVATAHHLAKNGAKDCIADPKMASATVDGSGGKIAKTAGLALDVNQDAVSAFASGVIRTEKPERANSKLHSFGILAWNFGQRRASGWRISMGHRRNACPVIC